MQDRDRLLLEPRNPIEVGDRFTARQVRGATILVPDETNAARHWASSPPADIYRQELRMIVSTPTVEQRVNYTSAGMMDATLESWLPNKMMNYTLMVFASILLLFLGAAAIGILIGAGLVQVAIPVELLALLLLVTVGLSVFALGVWLGVGLRS